MELLDQYSKIPKVGNFGKLKNALNTPNYQSFETPMFEIFKNRARIPIGSVYLMGNQILLLIHNLKIYKLLTFKNIHNENSKVSSDFQKLKD